jgi:hypothetical protein
LRNKDLESVAEGIDKPDALVEDWLTKKTPPIVHGPASWRIV